MKFTVEMTMKNTEGVLERVLGRMRQRNISVHSITANCSEDFSKLSAQIIVETQTAAEPIMKQLGKLYDVQELNVFSLDNTLTAALGEQNEVCISV
mgnify:CR=1 FL=1|jgi:acetolactate synthase regulatory subunit